MDSEGQNDDVTIRQQQQQQKPLVLFVGGSVSGTVFGEYGTNFEDLVYAR